ncbi:MAG: cation transporter [gamma proteobacterium symbiont of Bathyaustriella thionipta]|nr:cation transporter [gamma proteobacterium symbiont of Bathyaustriella thionipta]MCU7949249.1 cation transporter [gamma proteobacterium symbiont of Bathyaustriella thionipta]MCU7953673.1 cation transporter [gamma proteobacterium symbiont of Bathyaustriella thionipta]MCU7955837.1 cation transporter [gamma proteobacterium symbiont of Bathyaustriella thionipta]MCU7966935.1 cation transporter [gamma proteobacterium symbiont of Bathyaustriella thionipta]
MTDTCNLKITGMTCQHCVKHATEALEAIAGVESVEVNLEPGSAVVVGDVDNAILIVAVKEAGYEAEIA